jgi:hypothetical protein
MLGNDQPIIIGVWRRTNMLCAEQGFQSSHCVHRSLRPWRVRQAASMIVARFNGPLATSYDRIRAAPVVAGLVIAVP